MLVSKEKLEERHAFLMRGNDLLESAQLEIVISHLELYALLAEKEKEIGRLKIIVSRQSCQIAMMGAKEE
jgi:hypothetical protein